ncbi:unnamed protein product [Prunus armeniaca]
MAAATLVVIVGMWCSSLLCADQRTMLGHRRISLSGSELKWSASQGPFTVVYVFLLRILSWFLLWYDL